MLKKYGEVIKNASLEKYNTYGIKSSAKYLVKPTSKENLLNLVEYLKKKNMKYYILGKGSNVILPDKVFNGVIISLENLNKIEIDNDNVYVEAGAILSKFVLECINNNLSGLEYLALIPGTVGGALYGNAGVLDKCIYNNLVSVCVLREGEFITLKKDDIEINYRDTFFKRNNDIIISANYKLKEGNKEELMEVVKENRIKRLSSQPLLSKNAGSVFKNPEGIPAGKLIEELGLKGYTVGDAEVSIKHANFIINKGNAKSKDILELINFIKKRAYEERNINLELEQIIVEWE